MRPAAERGGEWDASAEDSVDEDRVIGGLGMVCGYGGAVIVLERDYWAAVGEHGIDFFEAVAKDFSFVSLGRDTKGGMEIPY